MEAWPFDAFYKGVIPYLTGMPLFLLPLSLKPSLTTSSVSDNKMKKLEIEFGPVDEKKVAQNNAEVCSLVTTQKPTNSQCQKHILPKSSVWKYRWIGITKKTDDNGNHRIGSIKKRKKILEKYNWIKSKDQISNRHEISMV